MSADDDLTPAEMGSRPKTGLFAGIAAVAVVAAMAGVAFVALREPPEPAEPPPVAVRPAAPPAPVPPLPIPPSPTAAPVDMGRIDSDLVPPSTEGLSPARRVQTIPIRVENDREIPAR